MDVTCREIRKVDFDRGKRSEIQLCKSANLYSRTSHRQATRETSGNKQQYFYSVLIYGYSSEARFSKVRIVNGPLVSVAEIT